MKIGLTYDLRDDYLALGFTLEQVAEMDTQKTITALEETIRSLGCETDRIGNVRALCQRLVAGGRWDLVFNIAEGLAGRGREAQVPCLLEAYNIPFTFSDPLVCATTLDKAVAKRIVASYGLRTPRFHVVSRMEDVRHVAFEYPLFAKPLTEGTGKGITDRSRVTNLDELRSLCQELLTEFKQPVLVEEYLPGREFTVGVLGTGDAARVLGTMEVEVFGSGIYSLEAKEKCEERVRYSAPPRDALRRQVEDLALASFRALECRDAARADVRLDRDGHPSFIEINPLPGLCPGHSDLPLIAAQEGMPYPELIGAIVGSALSRLEGKSCGQSRSAS